MRGYYLNKSFISIHQKFFNDDFFKEKVILYTSINDIAYVAYHN